MERVPVNSTCILCIRAWSDAVCADTALGAAGQSPLNPRVRGSSPWRRIRSDLGLSAFCVISPSLFRVHVCSTFARQSGPSRVACRRAGFTARGLRRSAVQGQESGRFGTGPRRKSCTAIWHAGLMRRSASAPPEAACFARAVVLAAGPGRPGPGQEPAVGGGKLACYGIGLGLEPVPVVLLHPSVIERFTAHSPGLSGPARRTLRTNLRFGARQVVPHLRPADLPLPRERAKAPRRSAGSWRWSPRSPRRSAGSWRWPPRCPRRRGRCARRRWSAWAPGPG